MHSILNMTKHIHSQSQPKGSVVMGIIDKYFEQAPGFQDVFDEETFYIFATVFTLATCLAAFVASRYITLKCKDWKINPLRAKHLPKCRHIWMLLQLSSWKKNIPIEIR